MAIKRGDIYFAKLEDGIGSEQNGERPVLVIQNDIGNRYSPTTIVASITTSTTKKPMPTHVELPNEKSGLPENSIVMLEQIHTIDKVRLERFVCHLGDEFSYSVNKAIRCSLESISGGKKTLCFRSSLHRMLYVNQVKNNSCTCSNQYLSALYLLTADMELWRRVKENVTEKEINLREVDVREISILGYVLLNIASDILYGTSHFALKDMSDTYLFYDRTFLLVIEALRICRYGYETFDFIEKKQEVTK